MESKFGVIRLKPTATVTLLSCSESMPVPTLYHQRGRATLVLSHVELRVWELGSGGVNILHRFVGGCRSTLHLSDSRRKIAQVVVVSSSAHSAPDLI